MVFLAGLLTRVLTGLLTGVRAGVRTGGLAFLAETLGAFLLFACPLALAAGALDGGGTWAVTRAVTGAITLAVTGAANGFGFNFGFGFLSLRATTLAAGASVAIGSNVYTQFSAPAAQLSYVKSTADACNARFSVLQATDPVTGTQWSLRRN